MDRIYTAMIAATAALYLSGNANPWEVIFGASPVGLAVYRALTPPAPVGDVE
jgi:hypothetical protein